MKKRITLFALTSLLLSCSSDDNANPVTENPVTVSPIVFNPNVTYGTMTDQDGNTYKTVTIGSQTWMAENLRTTKYRNGEAIPNITDNKIWGNTTTGAYCTYENNTQNTFIITYGRFYNGFAVNNTRKLAPAGWHIPTEEEWQTLIDYLGGVEVAGGKLKEVGTTHWQTPNTGATNSSGFTGLPSGIRYPEYNNGNFDVLERTSLYWTTTNSDDIAAKIFGLYHDDAKTGNVSLPDKEFGISVRCIKD